MWFSVQVWAGGVVGMWRQHEPAIQNDDVEVHLARYLRPKRYQDTTVQKQKRYNGKHWKHDAYCLELLNPLMSSHHHVSLVTYIQLMWLNILKCHANYCTDLVIIGWIFKNKLCNKYDYSFSNWQSFWYVLLSYHQVNNILFFSKGRYHTCT